MLRSGPRYLLRSRSPLTNTPIRYPRSFLIQSRLASTTSSPKSRTWKSLFVRLGLAAGVVYFYNTSTIFAEAPASAVPNLQPSTEDDESKFPISNSLATPRQATAPLPTLASQPYLSSEYASPASSAQLRSTPPSESPAPSTATSSLEETEAEASEQGAFNEETGEINWDCPCLGGMAHGTCGEHFRAAFSCFVYSKEDPKGMDCIEHFKSMQDCFREHPDEYGAELEDAEGDDDRQDGEEDHASSEGALARKATSQGAEGDGVSRYPSGEPVPEPAKKGLLAAETQSMSGTDSSPPLPSSQIPSTTPGSSAPSVSSSSPTGSSLTPRANVIKTEVAAQHKDSASESEILVPKAAHDAREAVQDRQL